MSFFRNKVNTFESSLVLFDIGASSVGVALTYVDKEGAHSLWEKRVEYAYQKQTEYERYKKSMLATLLNIGMSVLSEGVRVAERNKKFSAKEMRVVCILSAPWCIAWVGEETVTFPSRQVVTHHALDELRSHMFTRMTTQPEYLSWQDIGGVVEFMEQVDQKLVLDGYRVRFFGQYEATEVVLSSYLTAVPQQVVNPVREIAQRVFANNAVEIYSSTRVLSSLTEVPNETASPERHVLVEVSGPLTSVTCIDQNCIIGLANIPSGTYEILRACAPDAKSSEEAHSRADMLVKHMGDSPEIPEVVQTVLEEWAALVHTAIGTITHGATPPKQVVLLVRSALAPLFLRILSRPRFHIGIREDRVYVVRMIGDTYTFAPSHGLGVNIDTRMFLFACALRSIARHP